MTETQTETIYFSGDWEWNDTLDAYETAFAAVRVGEPWNGWATPLVTREVAEAFTRRQQMLGATDDSVPHLLWDGGGIIGYDDDGNEDFVIGPNDEGLFDLRVMGYTFVTIDHYDGEDANVVRKVG